MEKEKYGLLTAITMITGVVIGSGIFFKSDDVLKYTNGNMLLGIIVFCIAAIAIIFGCLTISQLANRTSKPGGIIAYAEEFVNGNVASAFGWFQMILYYPTLIAVVSWVAGMYICQLFSWEATNEMWSIVGAVVFISFFFFNILSARLGGILQNVSMLIKLLPLIIILVVGLILGEPGPIITKDMSTVKDTFFSPTWLAAFAPIAFSFDGWVAATSIGHEIKNSKRNLPLALTVAPLIVLALYVLYFIGMTTLIGPERVIAEGNNSVYHAANIIFGQIGVKVILVFVIISVMGTLNGLILAYVRMPYSLALWGMLPYSESLKKESKKMNQMPANSAILAFCISVFWIIIHYITQRYGMPGDVSEIAISFSYLCYIILYLVVIRFAKQGEIKNKLMGYVVPVIAILGSFIILLGSISHPLFIWYALICGAILYAGYRYYYKNNKVF